MMKRIYLAVLIWLCMVGIVAAQAPFQPLPISPPWLMQAKLTSPISVTTSSAATQLPSPGLTAWFCNTGAFDAYYRLGTANTVTTTKATGAWVKAGTCTVAPLAVGFNPQSTWVAFIGDGGSTTIYVETGMGNPPANASSGTITGTVTANQGTSPWVDNISQWGGANTLSGNGAGGAGGPRVSIANDNTIPTGWPTSAKQDTGNTSLASIDTKTPALSGGAVPVTPAATELHLGETGWNQISVVVAQTVTSGSAYASGNAVGGLITFAGVARVSGTLGNSGTGGRLTGLAVQSKSAQTTQMDLILFDANPSGSTCTDKTAVSIVAADWNKVIGIWHVTDWTSGGTSSFGQGNQAPVDYSLSSSTSLFGCLVTRSTPTFTATTDISVKGQFARN